MPDDASLPAAAEDFSHGPLPVWRARVAAG
jgi:hypothetical protein